MIEFLHRRRLAIACVLPAVAVVVFAAADVVSDSESSELGCWILPNGFVLRPPGSALCPLRTNDRVVAAEANPFVVPMRTLPTREASFARHRLVVEMVVERAGRELEIALPIYTPDRITHGARVGAAALIVAILMAIPLVLGHRDYESPAIPAISIFYGALAFIAAVGTTARHSAVLSEAGMLALAVGPASVLHLAMTFPRVRTLVLLLPQITWLPYSSLVLLLPMGWFALERTPIVWPAHLALMTFLLGSAWMILLLACHTAWAESKSSLERARARLLLVTACAVPIPIALLLLPASPSFLEATTTVLWSSAVVLPVAIGLAVSRYDLLDGPRASRSWLGTIAHVSGASMIIALFLGIAVHVGLPARLRPDVSLVFLLAFACAVAAELVRTRTARLSEMLTTPGVTKLNELHARFQSEVASFATTDELLVRLTSLIGDTLGCRGVSALLVSSHGYTEALRTGAPFEIEGTLSEQAIVALRGLPVAHTELMEDQPGAPSVEQLQNGGVKVIAELRHRSLPVGLLLLGGRRDDLPYTGTDLEFVARTCETAAGVLQSLQVAERLSGAGSGALQSMAEAVSHDLGKEVDWVTRLVRRLPHAAMDRDRLRRDIELVLDITSNVTQSLNDLLGRAALDDGDPLPVDVRTLIDAAVRHAAVLHGEGRVEHVVEDGADAIRVDRSLERVVTNLVDNALHASANGDPVRVFASCRDRQLRITVEDRGCGIPDESVYQLFEPGFTTRREGGGQGVGLSACRDIVVELEGAMEIARGQRGGTRATVLVPIS